MIAVAKSLLAGVETAVSAATKKDSTSPPFAETFHQVAADQTGRTSKTATLRTAKSSRTSYGGKKLLAGSLPGGVVAQGSVRSSQGTSAGTKGRQLSPDVTVESGADNVVEEGTLSEARHASAHSDVADDQVALVDPDRVETSTTHSVQSSIRSTAGLAPDASGEVASEVQTTPAAPDVVGTASLNFRGNVTAGTGTSVDRLNIPARIPQDAEKGKSAVSVIGLSEPESQRVAGTTPKVIAEDRAEGQAATLDTHAISGPGTSSRADHGQGSVSAANDSKMPPSVGIEGELPGVKEGLSGTDAHGVSAQTVKGQDVAAASKPSAYSKAREESRQTKGAPEVVLKDAPVVAAQAGVPAQQATMASQGLHPTAEMIQSTNPTTQDNVVVNAASSNREEPLGKQVAGRTILTKKHAPGSTAANTANNHENRAKGYISDPLGSDHTGTAAEAGITMAVAEGSASSALSVRQSSVEQPTSWTDDAVDSGIKQTNAVASAFSNRNSPGTEPSPSDTSASHEANSLETELTAAPLPGTVTAGANRNAGGISEGKLVVAPTVAASDVQASHAAETSVIMDKQLRGAVGASSAKERKPAIGDVKTENIPASVGTIAYAHHGIPAHPSTVAPVPTPTVPAGHQVADVTAGQAAVLQSSDLANAGLAAQSSLTGVAASSHAMPTQGASSTVGSDALGIASSTTSEANKPAGDHALSPLAHTTLAATPTVLEVGVPGGTQGWLKIRAEIGEGGVVQASLSASTHAGQDALRRDLPALSAFLANEHVPVNLQVTHGANLSEANGASSSSFDLGSSLGQSSGQNPGSSAGSGQSETAAGTLLGGNGNGQNNGRQHEANGRTSDAGIGSAPTRAVAGGADSEWSTPAGYGSGSTAHGGGWLNVIA